MRGDDAVDGEVEEEVPVNEEDIIAVPDDKISDAVEVDNIMRPSPDVHVAFIFTHPEHSEGLPGGKLVQFLMGFQNHGEKEFTVLFCETSFRYPQDFSYHIQNFSRVQYNRVVAAKQEATFNYAFYPSDQFAGRPLGLVVELQYEDSDGKGYKNTVFNETITIVEDESNFNTETGFLYVIFAAVVVLILLAGQHFLSKLTRKHGMAKSRQTQLTEIGTGKKNEVDFEWIPREVLNHSMSFVLMLSRYLSYVLKFQTNHRNQDLLGSGSKHSDWTRQIIVLDNKNIYLYSHFYVVAMFPDCVITSDLRLRKGDTMIAYAYTFVRELSILLALNITSRMLSRVDMSVVDPFGSMHKKTIELLITKVADYGLPSSANSDKAFLVLVGIMICYCLADLQSGEELGDFEKVLDSNLNADLLYRFSFSYLSDLYIAEKENISSGIIEENAEIGLLHICKKSINLVKERYDKCIELVNELRSNYEIVTERTSSLHNACDRMMAHQTQIAAGAEQIRANLYYYTQYESIMKKLSTGKFSITGQVFTQILSTIDECLRAMTVIRMGVMADLEASHNAVKDRYMKLDVESRQSDYSDDDTFALLYGVFAARANSIRSALNVAEQHFRDITEFQLMTADCQQAYFKIRYQMLEPVIKNTIEELRRTHESSSCALTRNGCAFLLRLCDDEFRLYKQFFTVGDDDDSGSRSTTVPIPSNLHASISAPFNLGTTSFDDFIESLCRVLYDILRPIVIHNPHLETLTELCTILKVEMIEERCGLMQSVMSVKRLAGYTNAGTSLPFYTDEYMNPRNGFIRVMNELLGDIAERIVYRTSLYAQSDIAEFIPSSGDLAYPEKLEMMREIEKEHTLEKILFFLGDINATSSTSAVNLYCLWYPTVRRTVLSLSKLFKCLEPLVFQSIAHELLTACCQSLEDAAEQIRNSAAEKISLPRRFLDAELFIVKHLLILREQTSPYRVIVPPGSTLSDNIPQRDYVFDFSKYRTSASQLFHDRHRWFELTSNNAFLEFLLQVPLAVTEAAGDSRRIIDIRLKTHCHNLINTTSDMIIFEFADYIAKAEETAATADFDLAKNDFLKASSMQNFAGQAYKKVTHLWPEIKECFDLYIGFRETENILLQPIKKRIIDVFTRAGIFVDKFYDDEQKQIASLPTQEHMWLVMNV
ncbi:unnamed protein product [Wuchereria bancrofti]|uniref:Conserved oligomeric Golgi complex subunit 3 n=2 Tax=Wuchereria bancrofti TaxID=6293 RepID=A0A3P7DJW8_WUCBA|nr:unnamed protein product [Wuchereria bancrofti]